MLTINDFILDACKITPGFEFYPKKRRKIELTGLLNILKEKGYYLDKDNSPFFIIVKTKDGAITIFSSFKIVVRETEDENLAKKMVEDILQVIDSTDDKK
jgi:ArsR family metal-binding transcriptional regulator